jgi:hypothetical protein
MLRMIRWHSIAACVLLCGAFLSAQSKSDPSSPAGLIGTWQGTSTCSDRVAAPACEDETVVYEFTAGGKAGTIRWVADKIVNGQRVPMGELDLEYDKTGPYWKATFTSPRVKTEWRLSVDGDHLTGTGRLLPGNEVVRKVDLKRSSASFQRELFQRRTVDEDESVLVGAHNSILVPSAHDADARLDRGPGHVCQFLA